MHTLGKQTAVPMVRGIVDSGVFHRKSVAALVIDASCVHVKEIMHFVHSTFVLRNKLVHHHLNAIKEHSMAVRRNAIAPKPEAFRKYPM